MDNQVIGINLRRIRKSKKLSQDGVAKLSGISRLAYSNIEKSISAPRVSTLQQIAVALDVKLIDLLSPARQLQHVRFRSTKKMTSREALLVDVARWLDDYNAIESLLQIKQNYKFEGFSESIPDTLDGVGKAKWSAGQVRSILGLNEREPIRDIAGLVESCGIKLNQICLASHGFFGLSIADDSGGPAVVVNTWDRIPVERWIFSAAHELGHLLLHLDSYQTEMSDEENEQETEANVFASYMLMPEQSFHSEWLDTSGLSLVERVIKVKRIFRVSYKTVLYRLSDQYGIQVWEKFYVSYKRQNGSSASALQEIDGLHAEEFCHSPESRRSKELETLLPSDFKDDRLAKLVRMAIEQDLISVGRGAEILRIDLMTMRDVISSWV